MPDFGGLLDAGVARVVDSVLVDPVMSDIIEVASACLLVYVMGGCLAPYFS